MYYSKRDSITRMEYLGLLGLKTLAKRHEEQLLDIKNAIAEIFQEVDQDGKLLDDPSWAGELTYTERTVDEVLDILKIKVEGKE